VLDLHSRNVSYLTVSGMSVAAEPWLLEASQCLCRDDIPSRRLVDVYGHRGSLTACAGRLTDTLDNSIVVGLVVLSPSVSRARRSGRQAISVRPTPRVTIPRRVECPPGRFAFSPRVRLSPTWNARLPRFPLTLTVIWRQRNEVRCQRKSALPPQLFFGKSQ